MWCGIIAEMRAINAGIVIAIICLLVLSAALAIVLVALYNVPLAQNWLPFLDISTEFPNKVIAFSASLSSWATIAIVIVALFTLKSAINTRKRELREQRVEEIHKWAQSVNEYALKRRKVAVLQGTEERFVEDQKRELHEIYEPFRSRSVYTETIATAISDDVKEAVIKLRVELQIQIDNLHKLRRKELGTSNLQETADILSNKNDEIHSAAVAVITTVANANLEGLD